jgi:hypothetical protein
MKKEKKLPFFFIIEHRTVSTPWILKKEGFGQSEISIFSSEVSARGKGFGKIKNLF